MLKRNVVVRSNIIVSVSEEKRVTDLVVVLLAINKRVGGQKAQPQQKKKGQKSKNRKGGGYDQETQFINQIILARPTQNRGLGNTQASIFLEINNQVKILTFA